MSKSTSKYLIMSSMSVPEFATSRVGTVAMFLIADSAEDRFDVAKWIKAGCSRAGSLCTQVTTMVLLETPDKSGFTKAKMLTATITREHEEWKP